METISAIVQAGADVNAASFPFGTPLCLAAIRRDLAAVTFLIEHNASVNKYCDRLDSAAHAACAGGNLDVIRALHAAGADWKASTFICVEALCQLSWLARDGRSLVTYCDSRYEYQAQSPGAVAVPFRHYEAVDFCLGLAEGLSVDETWKICLSYNAPGERSPGDSVSLLSLAMFTLDIPTAESLLDHGAHDSLLDPVGRGALTCALDATRLQSNNAADLDSAVKLLVRHGVDINGPRSPDRLQANAVQKFLDAWEHSHISGQLIYTPKAFGYGVLADAPKGTTALMYTIRHGNHHRSLAHCIEVLCNNGARVDIRDAQSWSALDLARTYLEGEEQLRVGRILLRQECVENGVDSSG
jgi:hypothetical protein